MYLARLANLLTWTALGYRAIAAAPGLGRPLLLLLLMPMSLFQAASASGDAMTNGLAVLFTATVWRYALPGRCRDASSPTGRPTRPITPVGFRILLVVTMALSLTKFAYLPLAALVLLIPAERFGGRRQRTLAVAAVGAAGLAAVLAWVPYIRGLNAVILDRPNVNPRQQVALLLSHPGSIGPVLLHTILEGGAFVVRSFVGRLGSVDVRLSMLFIVPYLAAMVAACWPVPAAPASPRLKRVLPVVMIPVGLSVASVALLNYVFWTPVGAEHVNGMQGRYLIPLAPAIIILLSVLFRRLPRPNWALPAERRLDAIAALIALVSCGYTLAAVYLRYYGRS